MESDGLNRLDMLSFDERTETWYIDARDSRRLSLTRHTLEGLVHLYNAIHSGNPLSISERRTLRRLEENNQRLNEMVRDLYRAIDSRDRWRPDRIAGRIVRRLTRRRTHGPGA